MKRILFILLLCSSAFGQFQQKPMLGEQIEWSKPISKGLVYLGLFNEGLGNTIQDSSGNKKTGPIGLQAVWLAGKFGTALYYTGQAASEVKFTQNAYDLFGIRRTATFLTWVQVDSATIHHGCISDYTSSKGFSLKITNGNKAEFYVYPNNHRVTGTVNVGANVWVQLVGVMDSTQIHLYVNGVYVGSDTLGEDIGDSAGVLHFGQRGDGADEMLGSQDHVIIWNRALSAGEVAKLYPKPFCMFQQDPVPLMSIEAPPAPTGGQVIMITSLPVLFIGLYICRKYKAA